MSEHIPSWAVWGDGSGTTFNAVGEAIHSGLVDFEIGAVFTNDPKAGILDFVGKFNAAPYHMDIEPVVVDASDGKRLSSASEEHVMRTLDNRGINNLALLGALTIMSRGLVEQLNGSDIPEAELPHTLEEARSFMGPGSDELGYLLPEEFPAVETDGASYHLFNTHPAPTIVTANTWGEYAHQRLVRLRSCEGGHTLHVVAAGIDTGPIVASRKFPIRLAPLNATDKQIEAVADHNAKKITQPVERIMVPLDMQAISNAQRLPRV